VKNSILFNPTRGAYALKLNANTRVDSLYSKLKK